MHSSQLMHLVLKFVDMRTLWLRHCALFTIALLSGALSFAQKQSPDFKGWHLKDKDADGIYGISLQQAYDYLQSKGRKPQSVIVGVLDGGIDTTHEDLKNRLWKNSAEVAGNGKDDDNNGYPDDRFGWNYLGNRNGENVTKETAEIIRIYHLYKDEFEGKQIDSAALAVSERSKYKLWLKANEELEMSPDEKQNIQWIEAAHRAAAVYDSVLRAETKKETFTVAELETFNLESPDARKAKFSLLRMFSMLQVESDNGVQDFLEEMKEYLDGQKDRLNAKSTEVTLYRRNITGDDEYNWSSRNYGNGDVMSGTPLHGSHVSGIIAAERNNGVGIDGVASNALILTVRNVPQGDEYDKDVALGIRYAVDNGAKVINMSFGKEISPDKKWVDEALAYAAQKDVLVVHAAGNDGANIDEVENFPTPFLDNGERAATMITVGASSDISIDGTLIANFSNYGIKTVDVFAPGVKIYSTVPHQNGYSFQQGTSMAAPVVSGIAALIRGYYPSLSAREVKTILEQSVDKTMSDKPFPTPGTDGGKKETITLAEACGSGGIVNAFKAVQMAEEWSKRKG